MVDVRSKRCSHDSCTTQPSYNVAGSKTAIYCKQHAENGMVKISVKHCSYDSCRRRPNFNVKGKKPVFCKQHAEDGMVNVYDKLCAHESCTSRSSFTVEGNKTPTYCKQHAEDGMVDVRTKRSSKGSCTAGPARGVPNKIETTASSRRNTDKLDESVVINRKRSRCPRGGNQRPHSLDPDPSRGRVVQTAEMGLTMSVSRTSSPRAFRRYSNDDTVGTAAKQNRYTTSEVLTPSPNENQSREPIKTEMGEVAVL